MKTGSHPTSPTRTPLTGPPRPSMTEPPRPTFHHTRRDWCLDLQCCYEMPHTWQTPHGSWMPEAKYHLLWVWTKGPLQKWVSEQGGEATLHKWSCDKSASTRGQLHTSTWKHIGRTSPSNSHGCRTQVDATIDVATGNLLIPPSVGLVLFAPGATQSFISR
jgi:hypothetical protein